MASKSQGADSTPTQDTPKQSRSQSRNQSRNQSSNQSSKQALNRDRRPFLWLAPVQVPRQLSADALAGLDELDARVGDAVPIAVRSIVNFCNAVQLERQRRANRMAQGPSVSILNRRRRAARAWIVSILQGKVDQGTLHALTHAWIPLLAGTGPEAADAAEFGERLIEFVRGVVAAMVMDEPADNLVPQAHALHSLETVLGIHLQALRDVAAGRWTKDLV